MANSGRLVHLAIGSRGDVEPHLALATASVAAGHEVLVLLQPEYRGLAERAGVPFASLGAGYAEYVASRGRLADLMNAGPLGTYVHLRRWFAEAAPTMAAAVTHEVRAGDTLIVGMAGLAMAVALQENLGCPVVHAAFQTIVRTGHGPLTYLSLRPSHSDELNRRWAESVVWPGQVSLGLPCARGLRRELGLPPLSSRRVAVAAAEFPTLVATSELLAPRAPDWPANTVVTGPWLAPPEPAGQAPSSLRSFLADGEPPVFVGFGSSVTGTPQRDLDLIMTAARTAGVRVVLQPFRHKDQEGPEEGAWGSSTDQVCVVDEVSYPWLFPQLSAVVHHGGAGTTVLGLRAGVPGAVVAFGMDQPFHGRRLAELGVGPPPLTKRTLSVSTLSDLLVSLTRGPDAPAYRRRAAEWGAIARAEDGVSRAREQLAAWGLS